MDSETQEKIEAAVLEILESVNMEETTEFKVRSTAAEKLGLDLSLPDRKRFVRQVVENFLQSKKDEETNQNQDQDQDQKQEEEEVEKEEEEEEEEGKKKSGPKEYDDEGDLIICRLSNKRRVTLQEFKGRTLVSIREYYEKDGKQLPSSKGNFFLMGNALTEAASKNIIYGISLTAEQWETFSNAVPKIEEAIKKLEEES